MIIPPEDCTICGNLFTLFFFFVFARIFRFSLFQLFPFFFFFFSLSTLKHFFFFHMMMPHENTLHFPTTPSSPHWIYGATVLIRCTMWFAVNKTTPLTAKYIATTIPYSVPHRHTLVNGIRSLVSDC